MNTEQITILVFLLLVTLLAVLLVLNRRRKRREEFVPMDDLEGHEFEFYCADLLQGSGFHDVTVTRGSGDYGADILCEKDGVTYAVQCKTYSSPIGVFAVQQAAAGRDYYDRMVGAVMTNQYYTKNAETAAKKLKILLWDRSDIERMEENAGR
ncbi:MAG: restriction endonuclease [Lachnospiraceae bacterium]|nr:restriction endonuclease [Lachnospiraceae bacterium]